MSRIDYAAKSIETKVVYWGAPGAGATESIRYLYERTKAPDAPSSSIARSDGHMHDLLPLSLGDIRGFGVRVLLFSTATHASEHEHRRELLRDVDGVVLLAAGTPSGLAAARASRDELASALASYDRSLASLPFVAAITHRDDAASLPLDACVSALALGDAPVFESIPPKGVGVFEPLKAISKLVLAQIARR